jgi:hypothetical protein
LPCTRPAENKERFLRTIKGEDIDILPVQCDFSAGGLERFLLTRGINNVSDLELLPFFDDHVLYAYSCNKRLASARPVSFNA